MLLIASYKQNFMEELSVMRKFRLVFLKPLDIFDLLQLSFTIFYISLITICFKLYAQFSMNITRRPYKTLSMAKRLPNAIKS